VILSVLAGLVNLGTGMLRRQQVMLMVMRFGLSIFSFIVAAVIIIAHLDHVALLPQGLHGADGYLYLFIAFALYVGLTLMLPATIERANPVIAAEQKAHTSGKLTGKLPDAGVRVANQNEEWVN
jgi:hypothetical protein